MRPRLASIPAYANRNRILARLVALFLLLFTTSRLVALFLLLFTTSRLVALFLLLFTTSRLVALFLLLFTTSRLVALFLLLFTTSRLVALFLLLFTTSRLVALFQLLFTTSSDVLRLKFGGVWEMLWIFKVARWTQDRCTKISKKPYCWQWHQSFILWDFNCKYGSAAYRWQPNKLMKLHLWRFKLEILQSRLPHRCGHFWCGICFVFIFEWFFFF